MTLITRVNTLTESYKRRDVRLRLWELQLAARSHTLRLETSSLGNFDELLDVVVQHGMKTSNERVM